MNWRNRKLVRSVQIIFGLILLLFGANSIFQFLPAMEFNSNGAELLGAFFDARYIFPIIGVIWVVCAVFFIIDQWSAAATLFVLPVTVNIILFHIFLDFTGVWAGLIMLILNSYMIYVHWPVYSPIFCRPKKIPVRMGKKIK